MSAEWNGTGVSPTGWCFDRMDERMPEGFEPAARDDQCCWFWGSHGCSLPVGHDGDEHVCVGCPDDDEPDAEALKDNGDGTWSPAYWVICCTIRADSRDLFQVR